MCGASSFIRMRSKLDELRVWYLFEMENVSGLDYPGFHSMFHDRPHEVSYRRVLQGNKTIPNACFFPFVKRFFDLKPELSVFKFFP